MAGLAALTLATCSQAGSYPMPTASPKKQFFTLTADDEIRLQRIAPLFDIDFSKLDDETYVLRTSAGEVALEVELP